MELRRYYERPEAELLVVRFERGFLNESPGFNASGNEKLVFDSDGPEEVGF